MQETAQTQTQRVIPHQNDRESKPERSAVFHRAEPTAEPGALSKRLREYLFAFAIFIGTTALNLLLRDLIGYPAIAMIYLLSVVLMGLFLGRLPLLIGTILTTGGWVFLAPPLGSFYMDDSYDRMMVLIFLLVAFTIGHLMSRLRAHKEAEIKLLSGSERLGRALLNSVSHELRTPIAVITSASSELRESRTLSPLEQKLAVEIESAGTRLDRIVQSLLSAARVQSGQLHPKIDWCDIADLVSVSVAGTVAWTEGRTIEEKIAPELPLVKMDFVLMEQALTNLLINAAMHTPAGTAIEIAARIEKKELIMEVADRGPGLPPSQLEQIFDLFHRLPGAKPGGTGLGLAIVKGFIETQNGRVKAANRLGGGAVFTIAMPLGDKPELPEETV